MARVKYVKPCRSLDPSLQSEEKSQQSSKGVKADSVSWSSSTPETSPANSPATKPETNPITPAASAAAKVSVPRTIANDDKYTEPRQPVMNESVLRPVTAWRPMRVYAATQMVPAPQLVERIEADRRSSLTQTSQQLLQADLQESQQPSQSQAAVMKPEQSGQKQTGGRRSRELSLEEDLPSPKRRRSDG